MKPEDFDNNVQCNLSSDGVLSIRVNRKPALTMEDKDKRAKLLPIKLTGEPACASPPTTATNKIKERNAEMAKP